MEVDAVEQIASDFGKAFALTFNGTLELAAVQEDIPLRYLSQIAV